MGRHRKVLLQKTGVEITAFATYTPSGRKSVYELLEAERGDRPEVFVSPDIDKALPTWSDVCIVATDSFTKDAYPKLMTVLSRKVNAICTAER
jgi:4-hydroxy-tetrahydrodipicolinate reductase